MDVFKKETNKNQANRISQLRMREREGGWVKIETSWYNENEREKERKKHTLNFFGWKKVKNPNEFGWKTQKENTWKNVIKFLITDYLFILRRKNQIQTNYIHLILLFFSPIHLRMFDFTFLFQNVPFENDEKEIWKGVFLEYEKKECLELNFNLFCMRKNKKTQKKRGKKRENCIFVFLSNRKCGGFSCQIQNRSNFFHFLAGECNSVGRCFYLNCSLDWKNLFLFASEWSVV